jgi:hypothetical protein
MKHRAAALCVCVAAGCTLPIPDASIDAGPQDLATATAPDLMSKDLTHHRPTDMALPESPPSDFAVPCPSDLGTFDLTTAPHAATDHVPSFAPMIKDSGPVVSSMQAWTVVWQGDEAIGAETNAFLAWMLTSDYWQVLAQYGVGPGTTHGVIVLPLPAPTSAMVAVQAALSAGGITPDADTALFFVPPPGPSFATVSAYHHHVQALPYAVVTQLNDQGDPRSFDEFTFLLSHEAAELATDPEDITNPAWYRPPGPSNLAEIGDLCELVAPSITVSTGAMGGVATYRVTRLYSNLEAATGTTYACAPDPVPLFGMWEDPQHSVVARYGCTPTPEAFIHFAPFSAAGDATLHWQAHPGPPGCHIDPTFGDVTPGTDFFVRVWSDGPIACGGSGSFTAPAHPGYELPFNFSTFFK